MLGTNGAVIANNEAVSADKGTDFGQVIADVAVTNTFSITNAAATTLTISSWTTNGTGADKFSVIDMPATVGANSLSNFSLSFNPAGSAGTYTATVSIVNSGTNTPYLVNLQGEALSQGAIGIIPTSLAYTATYNGTNPASQTFTLTNSGETAYTYANTVTYGAGASGWFLSTPANGTVTAGRAQISTGSVNITGINAGTYYATNVVTSPTATNSPQTLPITLTINLADQTITFTNPGEQNVMNTVGLAATASSGLEVSFAVGSGPGSISGGTNLSFTATGTVSIVASQAGNTNWNPAPSVTNTFNVRGYTPGDYTGDGKTDLAVYDEATGYWYIRAEDGTVILWQGQLGGPGYTPVQGDYDGDGIADFAVYYEPAGTWFIVTINQSLLVWDEPWGGPGFTPVPGDYNGDGISDLAVYYGGYWFVETVDGTLIMYAENWGAQGFEPVGK